MTHQYCSKFISLPFCYESTRVYNVITTFPQQASDVLERGLVQTLQKHGIINFDVELVGKCMYVCTYTLWWYILCHPIRLVVTLKKKCMVLVFFFFFFFSFNG